MDQATFEKEIAMCKKLNKESGGCNWGRCESCGVIPLLYKLYKGEVVEKKEDVDKLKADIFN